MAKKSKIIKNQKQMLLIAKYAEKYFELKKNADYEGLSMIPAKASKVRYRNRDSIDGRSRGYMRKFGISRIKFRELAHKGEIPGIKKASW